MAQKEAQKKPCNTKICLDPRLDLSFPNISSCFNEPVSFKKPMSTTIFLSQLTRFLFQKTDKSFGSFLKEKPNVRRHGEELHVNCLAGFLLLVGAAGLSKGDGWQCAPRPDSCDGHMEMLENKATIRMARSLAAPFMVDWNGDGLTDLLVGQGDGSIWYYQRAPQDRMLYYKNNTDKSNPFRVIKPIPIDEHGGQHPAGPVVVDWDMDGQLELILAVAGHLRYFKQHEGELVEQEGLKNPFHEISFSSIAPTHLCS